MIAFVHRDSDGPCPLPCMRGRTRGVAGLTTHIITSFPSGPAGLSLSLFTPDNHTCLPPVTRSVFHGLATGRGSGAENVSQVKSLLALLGMGHTGGVFSGEYSLSGLRVRWPVNLMRMALKGAIPFLFFSTISSLNLELSPTRTLEWPGHNHVKTTCNTSAAYHLQYVMRHVVQRDTSDVRSDRAEIVFVLVLFHWLNPVNDKGGRGDGDKTGVPGENPLYHYHERSNNTFIFITITSDPTADSLRSHVVYDECFGCSLPCLSAAQMALWSRRPQPDQETRCLNPPPESL